MADGAFRSLQGTSNIFRSSSQPRGQHQRAGSPAGGSQFLYNPNTPSPPRSSSTRAAQQGSKMYNQNQAQGQHAMLNGAHHRYGMQMGMNKGFPHQNQQHHGHQQHHQHQDHNTGHGGNYAHHQHNHSSGGLTGTALANAASHFNNSHNQNGASNAGFGAAAKAPNEHWALQMQLASQAREMTMAHPHARNASGNSRSILAVTTNGASRDAEKEEKTRHGLEPDSRLQELAWTALDLGGQNLKLVSAALFRYSFLTKLYLNNNRISQLPSVVGRLRNLVILDLSLNELRELPPEIGMLINLKQFLLIDNQLETLPYEMGTLYQLQMLGVEGNPLDEDLKNIIVENGTTELIKYLRENSSPPEPPNDRPWIVIDESPVPEGDKFSALSYNILCEKSATQSQHGYTPSQALAWERRREVVLDEIRARDADIVSLQEMDSGSYNEYFRGQLAHDGYKGAYVQKSRATTMAEKDARMVDGSAVFYKHKKFILLDKQSIDFRKTAINRPDMKGETDIFNRVMLRDDIAIILFLENRQTGARLIVANVHVVWDPKYKDVKVVQTAILMEQLDKFAAGWALRGPLSDKEKMSYRFEAGDEIGADGEAIEAAPQEAAPSQSYPNGTSIPVIIAGDFNSMPDSGVYELISQGSLSHLHSDMDNRKYGNFTRDGMTHPFTMKSAYASIGEPRFTNYTPGFVGVLDYIWYSSSTVQVRGLLGDVDSAYLERVPGFPNWHFPSDHLCLYAEFAIRGRKAEKKEADFGKSRSDKHRP